LHSDRFVKLSPADHALLTELVMGVLRWRGVLDHQIAEHSTQALAKFDREVLASLRIGAYELLFLDRIPKHAATNESVELVKRARKKSAAGMVNAVLRKIAAASPHFSQTRWDVGHPLLNSRSAQPEWLVERWRRWYGAETASKICDHSQSLPSTSVRV